MPDLSNPGPIGSLRSGWSAEVGDYAIDSAWSANGEVLVVGDAAGGVYAFEGRSGAERWGHAEVHERGLLALEMHPDGALFATAGQDGCVRIWGAADGEVRNVLDLGKGWAEKLAWSTDGRLLAASLSRAVYVFDLDGQQIWRSEDQPSTVSALAWAGPGELAIACYGRVSFIDVTSNTLLQRLEWKGSLVSMVLSPDGSIVACGSQDNSVHFWRRESGEDSAMHGYPGKPSALAFDGTGTLLATNGGPHATVWSFHGEGPEGTRPGVLKLHVEPITTVSFARRGRRLASGGRDGVVAVWDLQMDGDGEVVGAAVVEEVIAGLAWRPDGRGLAALDGGGGVTVWRVGS